MKAICIDDTMKYKRIVEKNNSFGITKDKEYEVKQSKYYDNYYELINDLGIKETYKKERFKIVEGEKMQEGIIKVRCINNLRGEQHLTIGKEYIANKGFEEGFYKVKNDKGNTVNYSIQLFEIVPNDVLMMECIDNTNKTGSLTLNKKYKVTKQMEGSYLIIGDDKEEYVYNKNRFKPVEPHKEIKEYTLQEVIANIKDNETYIQNTIDKIAITKEGKGIRINRLFECDNNTMWINEGIKFTKVEPKTVTTSEAMKALIEEGKIIESAVTKNQFKLDIGKLMVKGDETNIFIKSGIVSAAEIEGTWIIIE